MKSAIILAILASALVATSAAPSFKLLAKAKKAEIAYKLLPHLGFAKYNAVKYEPLRESPAAVLAPAVPYPAEVVAVAPAPAPYPAAAPAPYPAPAPYVAAAPAVVSAPYPGSL